MPEASRIRFYCGHKARLSGILEQTFPGQSQFGEYEGAGDYEARELENGVILYWKVGNEPRAKHRVLAGPPLGSGDWVS